MKKIIITFIIMMLLLGCNNQNVFDLETFEQDRVIKIADEYLKAEPITITNFIAERSTGGVHDYYSEGDYWWPNPEDPTGPYIRKDGLTNPDNFVAHRKAMRRFSIIVPALVAAYKITGDEKYAEQAVKHLNAWFVNPDSKMNPNLLYAQAISGKVAGRGIGIIDTIHLVEVAQAIIVLEKKRFLSYGDALPIKQWFEEYLKWLVTSDFGIEERDNGNNHSTCWVMQAGMYAKLVNNEAVLIECREIYKHLILQRQVEADGSFPLELKRTKPYGYSLFNLDAMVMVCAILTDATNNMWQYATEDGKNIKDAMEFMYPYIKDKSKWPYKKDVMYFDQWPVRQPSLLFAGFAFKESKYIELWKTLNPDPTEEEIIRNFPIRQPVLWI
ncbi:MAG: alginate lyase family protein [Bacteroidetes bacterium]|nr:alginate lyase family protein [Bacteroidota bacterium]